MNKPNIFSVNNNGNIILPTNNPLASIVRMSIKRLRTKDGLCGAASHIKIGDTFLIDKSTMQPYHGYTENGQETTQIVVDEVDETGKKIGEFYAELFFG